MSRNHKNFTLNLNKTSSVKDKLRLEYEDEDTSAFRLFKRGTLNTSKMENMQPHSWGPYTAEYKQNKGYNLLFDPRNEFPNCISLLEGEKEEERKLFKIL